MRFLKGLFSVLIPLLKLMFMNKKATLVVLFLLTSASMVSYKYFLTVSYVDATISKTEGNKDTIYMVYTDADVYKVVDDWFYLNVNSANLYGKLIPRQKYRLKVQGIRSGFFTWYKNIISAENIEKELNAPHKD